MKIRPGDLSDTWTIVASTGLVFACWAAPFGPSNRVLAALIGVVLIHITLIGRRIEAAVRQKDRS
jgi:hypothetical protein